MESQISNPYQRVSAAGTYRPDIDGLRAIAVLLVLFYHAGLAFPGGFIGVDVFFVISGYLITGILGSQLAEGTLSIPRFMARRALRIMPAAALMSITCLVLGAFVMMPEELVDLGKSGISQVLAFSNVYFWMTTGYFTDPAEQLPLLHTWSLAVEEQFYVFLPIALLILGRWRMGLLPTFLAAVFLLSLLLSHFGVQRYPAASFFLLPTRAWELLLGSVLCYIPAGGIKSTFIRESLGTTGLLLIMIPALSYGSGTSFPGLMALPPCLGSAFLILSGCNNQTIIGCLLSSRPMVGIGLISYSIYLWHWPAFAFLRILLGEPSMIARIAACLGSVVFAYFSWRFIEVPFRRDSSGARRRRALATTAFLTGLSMTLSAGWMVTDGLPQRIGGEAREYYLSKSDVYTAPLVTLEMVRSREEPSFGPIGQAGKLLLWGDSHAKVFTPAAEIACNSLGLTGHLISYDDTPPLVNFPYTSVAGLRSKNVDYAEAVVSRIESDPIDVVILSGYWSRHFRDRPDAFVASFEATVLRLVRSGTKVIVSLDVADHSSPVPGNLARRSMLGLDLNGVGCSPERYSHKNSAVNTKIRELAAKLGASVFDPATVLSDRSGFWPAVVNGVLVYRDRDHLTMAGARLLGPTLTDVIRSSLGNR